MKKIVFLFSLLMFNYCFAFDSSNSYTDSLGNTHTTFSDGSTANSYTDSLGNTRTTFSDGSTANSYTDSLGNTHTTYN